MRIKPFYILLLVCVLLVFPKPASATPINSRFSIDSGSLSLRDLGYTDFSLHSPYDSNNIRFTIPSSWTLASGGEVILNYDVLLSGTDVDNTPNGLEAFGGTLSVLFNNEIIGNININSSGQYSLPINIPDYALVSKRLNGEHELSLNLSANEGCNYDIRTNITIRDDSVFNLFFSTVPPSLDLARLPYPFYPNSMKLPEKTILVLPDNADQGELEAALNVSSSFGSLTKADFSIEAITLENLTEELRSSSNIIFVGLAGKFPDLSTVQFSVPVINGQISEIPADSTDGIIQLANSPWNPGKSIMLVSGNTIIGLSKAARAISVGELFTFGDSKYVLISDVSPFAEPAVIIDQFTFQDLGYKTKTVTNIGTSGENYTFYLPKEQVTSRDANVEIKYLSSIFTDNREASIKVTLNQVLISLINLKDVSKNLNSVIVNIPAGVLQLGENTLRIEATLIPTNACDVAGERAPFISILEESIVNIPIGPPQLQDSSPVDLRYYPDILNSVSDYRDVTFVLPENNPAAWQVASQLALYFGQSANITLPSFEVVFGDNVSQDIKEKRNLVVVGLPEEIPFLNEINEQLPAPFDFEANTASETDLRVSYRVPSGVGVGYVELLQSPYKDNYVILVVAGNSIDGLQYAGNILTNPEFKTMLSGHFVVTNGSQVASAMISRYGFGTSLESVVVNVAPDSEKIIISPMPQIAEKNVYLSKPIWLVPFFILSLIIFLSLVVFNMRKSKKTNRVATFRDVDTNEEKSDTSN